MKRKLHRILFVHVGFWLCLGLNATGNAAEKAPQPLNVKSLTMGLVFQNPSEPVPEPLREFVTYVARKLSSTPAIAGTVVVAPTASHMVKLLEEKRVDFYMESPHATYLINRLGSATLLLRRWKGGMGEYRSVIFTNKESGISRVEELRGKMIAFEDAEGRAILQRTDNTTKFDLLPGGEQSMRKQLIELFRPRGKK